MSLINITFLLFLQPSGVTIDNTYASCISLLYSCAKDRVFESLSD